jgi:hypothetical protein
MLGLLALALWDGYEQWISVVGSVPAWGWLMTALGGGLSVALGVGLMTLIFYSSRKGYDEPSQVVECDDKSGSRSRCAAHAPRLGTNRTRLH